MTKTDKPDDYDRVAVETASIAWKLGYSAGTVTECEAIARMVEALGAAAYDGKVYARDVVDAIRARGKGEIDE
jgi:hypothetical protein